MCKNWCDYDDKISRNFAKICAVILNFAENYKNKSLQTPVWFQKWSEINMSSQLFCDVLGLQNPLKTDK